MNPYLQVYKAKVRSVYQVEKKLQQAETNLQNILGNGINFRSVLTRSMNALSILCTPPPTSLYTVYRFSSKAVKFLTVVFLCLVSVCRLSNCNCNIVIYL